MFKIIVSVIAMSLSLISAPLYITRVEAQVSDTDLRRLVSGGDLSFGMRNSQVTLLQTFLSGETDNYGQIYSQKNITGYFGSLTSVAVARFQRAHSIYPASGYFGKLTRAFIGHRLVGVAPSITPIVSQVSPLPSVSQTDYLNSLIDASKNLTLSQSSINKLKRDKGVIATLPLLLQELQTASQAGDTNKINSLKEQISIWGNFYSQMYNIFQPIKAPATNDHLLFMTWLKYNQDLADTLTNNSFSSTALTGKISEYNLIFKQYKTPILNTFAISENTKHQQVAQTTLLQRLFQWFMPGNVANALGLGFGGIISIDDICTNGELISVTGTSASGAFFLYWTVYASNPYLYDAVYYGNWILGLEFPVPGICNQGTATYPIGEGTIQFFGTALY